MLRYKKFVKQPEDFDFSKHFFPVYVHGKHEQEVDAAMLRPTSNTVLNDVLEAASFSTYSMRRKYDDDKTKSLDKTLSQHYGQSSLDYKDNPEHFENLRKYSGDSKKLNSFLVSNHKDELALGDSIKKHADTLSAALSAKPAPTHFHVHSGLGFDPGKHMSSTGKLTSPAFLSASIDPSVASSFAKHDDNGVKHIMRIKIPKGSHHGAYIDPISYHQGEKEFLMNKGITYKVNKKPIKLYDGDVHTHSIWHAEPMNTPSHNPYYNKVVPKDAAGKDQYISKVGASDNTQVLNHLFSKHGHEMKPHHISQLLEHPNAHVRAQAISNETAVTPEHVAKAMSDSDLEVVKGAVRSPAATHEQISKGLEHSNKYVRRSTISNPSATSEHITKALNDPETIVRREALRHPNVTGEHITKALNGNDSDSKEYALSHPTVTTEHISKALNDNDMHVRETAIKHPKATAEHISKALDDPHYTVRGSAIDHPNATADHISKALNDKDDYIRYRAIMHPNATEEHISKALDDSDTDVRSKAIKHPKVTTEHLSKALDDKNPSVRALAIRHPKATKDHILKALTDPNMNVADIAKQRAKELDYNTGIY